MVHPIFRKSALLLLFCLGLMRLQAQTTKITDPVKYNDFIVTQQNNIGTELIKLIGMFQELPEEKQVTMDQLNVVIANCDKAIENTKKLVPIAHEFGLKQSALDLFQFYKDVMSTEYVTMIDELYEEIPNIELLDGILVKVQEKEAVVDQAFQKSQQDFADYHKIRLEENELQEKLDGEGDDVEDQ
jgi:hypothetical protein